MRLTATLYKKLLRRQVKDLWKRRGVMRIGVPIGQNVLLRKGVEIQDLTWGMPKPELERWEPAVKDDPTRRQHPKREEKPNWNEEAAYVFYHRSRLTEGLQQACVLSKSQLFDGMPDGVKKLIGRAELPDQDEIVQECIMLSQEWNPTMEKLPKRFDKEKIGWHFVREYGIPQFLSEEILMRSLLFKCQSLSSRYPSLLQNRRQIRRPYLGSHYYFRDELINIQGHTNWMVTSDRPLPLFGSEEMLDQSVSHQIPDLWPMSPTISISRSNNYTVQSTTGFTRDVQHIYPHIIFLSSNHRWRTSQKNAVGLMYSLGYCLAEAKRRYGENVTSLPEPVCTQLVHMDHQQIDFIFFQLNTLNFSNDDGVKNFVWVDPENVMYRRHLPQPWKGLEYKKKWYSDYEPEVFRKLLAVYLYGVPEVSEDVVTDDARDTLAESSAQS